MAGEQRGRELNDQVRHWLQQQDPPVKFTDDYTERTVSKSDSLSADFMVMSPFPMAIIAMTFPGPNAMRMKSKRFLAQRIALAERFGSYMPVVVVVPYERDTELVPFADAVLSAEKLPDFEYLRLKIKLNPDVQTIFRDGEPPAVSFSEEADVTLAWDKALTLEDLSSENLAFPQSSLARRIQELLMPLKKATLDQPPRNPNESLRGSPIGSIRQSMRRNDGSFSSPWWTRSRHWSDEFDRVLFQFIIEKCGGKVESKRHRDPLLRGQILRHVWKSGTGREVVLRRQTMSGVSESHKTRELVAEAWMSRAFLKPRVSAQVLLAGASGVEPAMVKTIEGLKPAERESVRLGIQHVNALEAAGWLVAPWDFAEEEPNFIKLLKEVDHV